MNAPRSRQDFEYAVILATNPSFTSRGNRFTDPAIESNLISCKVCAPMQKFMSENFVQCTLDQLKSALNRKILKFSNGKFGLEMFDGPNGLRDSKQVKDYMKTGAPQEFALYYVLLVIFRTAFVEEPTVSEFHQIVRKMDVQYMETDQLENDSDEEESLSDDLVIASSLQKALSYLPCYQDICVRAVNLTHQELSKYKKGSIITWTDFSSSSQGVEPVAPFDEGNTYFKISSCTGRLIAHLSVFPGEKEVLFPAHCNFMVTKRYVQDGKTIVEMREVDLRMANTITFWIDKNRWSKDWSYKADLDEIRASLYPHGILVIPVCSLDQAKAFSKSSLGQVILSNTTKIQVLRTEERPFEIQPLAPRSAFSKCIKKDVKLKFGVIDINMHLKEVSNESKHEKKVGDYDIIQNEGELRNFIQGKQKIIRGILDEPSLTSPERIYSLAETQLEYNEKKNENVSFTDLMMSTYSESSENKQLQFLDYKNNAGLNGLLWSPQLPSAKILSSDHYSENEIQMVEDKRIMSE